MVAPPERPTPQEDIIKDKGRMDQRSLVLRAVSLIFCNGNFVQFRPRI